MSFDTHGPPPNTGSWVQLDVSGQGVSDNARVFMDIRAPGVSVAPTSGTYSPPTGIPTSVTFTVTNTSQGPSTYTLSTSCPSLNNNCPPAAPQLSFQGLEGKDVTVSFTPGQAGVTQNITLTASTVGASASGQYTITPTNLIIQPPSSDTGVLVTPKNSAPIQVAANNGAASYSFTVQNLAPTGAPTKTFKLIASCTGAAVCNYRGTADLGGQKSTNILVPYSTNASAKTGTVQLSAASGVADAAILNLNITLPTTKPFVVASRSANLNGSVARDACLDMPLPRGGASYECGDLRVAYPLPPVTTMNKTRQPRLLFLSSTANATAVIEADVTIVQAGYSPTQLTPKLTLNGVTQTLSPIAWTSSCTSGTLPTCRITIPVDGVAQSLVTGVYPYTLQLDATVNSVTTSVSDNGTVTIVNRVDSPYGRGWWLEGVEQILSMPGATTKLWVGGDGSTRVFTPTPGKSGEYTVVNPLDGPDTLLYDVATNKYQRRLSNGAYTEFDGTGLHIGTVNALGHRTTFGYTSGAVSLITVPTPNNVAGPQYQLTYTTVAGKPMLAEVHLVGTPTIVDQPVYVTAPTGWVESLRFLASTNTETMLTSYAYEPIVTNPAATRTLRRITTMQPGSLSLYFTLGKLTKECDAPLTENICTSFSPSDTVGRTQGAPIQNAYTSIDGPLQAPFYDVTRFYVNRFGAPDSVINAIAQKTKILRTGPFPLLATQVIENNNFTTETIYNDRALPDIVRTISPAPYPSGGPVSTMFFKWNGKWDLADVTTMPTGEWTTRSYDMLGAFPKLLYQEDGRGATSRVNFTIDPTTKLLQEAVLPGRTKGTKYAYDGFGNLWTTTTANGYVTTITRDEIGRPKQVDSPVESGLIRTDETSYNARGLVSVQKSTGPAMNNEAIQIVTATNDYTTAGQL
ncbi:MAG TPA: hypothetical protein VF461_17660, partial [Gemmatimonadaceae bacterium]